MSDKQIQTQALYSLGLGGKNNYDICLKSLSDFCTPVLFIQAVISVSLIELKLNYCVVINIIIILNAA